MRVVFMGTPDFAAVHLRKLSERGHSIACVYTQPDRPKGRGKQPQKSAVKREAEARGLPVRQPVRLADAHEVARLADMRPDAVIVVAFGQKLPPEVLSLPPYGCVNIHASMLPKYRGAAPIQYAILNGESETGVTSMRMDEGWDTGDILMQRRVPIGPETDAGMLHDRLADVGAELLISTLDALETGQIQPTPQNDALATFAPKLRKEDGLINWTAAAVDIERKVRALRPWPGAFTYLEGAPFRIWRAAPAGPNRGGEARRGGAPGSVLAAGDRDGKLVVQTGDGALELTEVQPANRRRMAASDFARGARLRVGSRFADLAPTSEGDAGG